MSKSDNIIRELELFLIEHAAFTNEEREAMLPLTKPRQIYAMIYNLFTHEPFRSKISYKDYIEIQQKLMSRIINRTNSI